MNPTKIFELKGKDIMQGLSIQSGLALGGIYQTAANFDPFETMGYLQPSLAPVQIDPATITTQTNYFTSTTDGYVYALGHRAGTGGKCFYRIKVLDGTVTDYSDYIGKNEATGAIPHNGLAFYGGRIIYESNNKLRSNANPPVNGTGANEDVEILATDLVGSTSTSLIPTVFCIGHDGYLYYTAVYGYGVGKIVTTNATTNNINNAFTFTDHNLYPKDITDDGTYLIITADTNPLRNTDIESQCKVFFWDCISAKASIIYTIPDSYLISGKYIDGKVVILGASGIWICNQVSAPKLVFPLSSTKLPTGANQVTVKGNIMYWTGANGKVYAFGAKIGNPIVYSPFVTTDSDNLQTAIISSGPYFFVSLDAGTNTPKIYQHNSGTTRASLTAQTTTITLPQQYSLSYVKMDLKSALSAGQTVSVKLLNGNSEVIMDTNDKAFATVGAIKNLVFNPKPATNSVKVFEDISLIVILQGGAVAQRISIYGVPTSDYSQK
jgi:hypothetical protein